jgi:hypothetical protein
MRIYRQVKTLAARQSGFKMFGFDFMKTKGCVAMKQTTFFLLSAVLIVSSSGWAAPLNRSHVPAEAKWLLHLDFDAFGDSELWRLVSQEISEKEQKKIDAITALLDSDPTKDIHGATLYGTDSQEENAVVMLYGRFNKEKLLSLLVLNEAYAEDEYNGRKLYHWVDEKDNKQKVGMFATDSLIVISQSEQSVQASVDLLAGQVNSLAGQADAPLGTLVETPENAFMVIAADGLAELNKDKQHAAILQNSKMMAVVVGENNGDLYLKVNLTAETDEAAMQIEQVLVGIKSFIALKYVNEPEIMSLFQATTLQRNENKLSMTVQYSSAKLFEMIKAKRHIDIWTASATGNIAGIKQQLSAGTDINVKEPVGGSSPLLIAAISGQSEAAMLLVEKGADLNSKNNNGSTALHLSAFFAHPEIVKLLLDKGVDVTVRNNRGETALDTVAAQWSPELAGIYKWLGGILQMELDLERIKATRPAVADLLRKNE